MSRGYTSIFAGFATLCLGLIAASSIPVGLPTALGLAFGESLSADQLGLVELVLMAVTVLLTVVFVTDGVISGLRGPGETANGAQRSDTDDADWIERFMGR
jgi:hypothetical protein